MKALPALVLMGDPQLMQRQSEVSAQELATEQFQSQLDLLKLAMSHYQGIGIAAPQLGWNARVFCLGIATESSRYPEAPDIPFNFWINPTIVNASVETVWAWEGCLSVPGMRGWVQRPRAVTVSGLCRQGRRQQETLDGFAARVWQHEYDHLDGVLYPMRVTHPRWLLPLASLELQSGWPAQWPSPGAAETRPGQLCAHA